MVTRTQIGSGRPQFILPGNRFDQISKNPLAQTEKEPAMADDHFQWWRNALAGVKQHTYDSEPMCGYFAVQDRSPGVTPAKGNRWPKIPCAIWRNEAGDLVAERAGERVEVERVWPYCAKNPIPYETYQFWHDNERWPDEEKAA